MVTFNFQCVLLSARQKSKDLRFSLLSQTPKNTYIHITKPITSFLIGWNISININLDTGMRNKLTDAKIIINDKEEKTRREKK